MEYHDNTCSCGATCPTHGIISHEDRHAAWRAGYEHGIAVGRVQSVKDEVAQLGVVAEVAEWLTARTLAVSREGVHWADTVAPAPGGADDLG